MTLTRSRTSCRRSNDEDHTKLYYIWYEKREEFHEVVWFVTIYFSIKWFFKNHFIDVYIKKNCYMTIVVNIAQILQRLCQDLCHTHSLDPPSNLSVLIIWSWVEIHALSPPPQTDLRREAYKGDIIILWHTTYNCLNNTVPLKCFPSQILLCHAVGRG